MARYRVDNRFLSEEEYEAHLNASAGGWAFLLTWVALCVASYTFVSNHPEWPRAARFALSVVVPFFVAAPLRRAGRLVRHVVAVVVAVLVLALIVGFLWNLTG